MKPWLKAVLGVLAVALPAVFNYASARLDNNEAKIRAAVAYEANVETVKGLQLTVHGLELDHAEMKGQLHELRRSQAARVGAAAPPAPELPRPAPAMKAPPAFEDAVQSYKAAAKK